MTTQLSVASRPHGPGIPDGCVSLADIEYLLDTGRIDHVTLAGVPMVSLDGIRDYLRRHDYFGGAGTCHLGEPGLFAEVSETIITGGRS